MSENDELTRLRNRVSLLETLLVTTIHSIGPTVRDPVISRIESMINLLDDGLEPGSPAEMIRENLEKYSARLRDDEA